MASAGGGCRRTFRHVMLYVFGTMGRMKLIGRLVICIGEEREQIPDDNGRHGLLWETRLLNANAPVT